MTQDVSFRDFYLDPSLPGHSLLEPSILVGEGYGRIFSPIEESGCDAFVEVITRIALFVILPIGALFSALLIPFGLAVKGLSLCCAPDPEPMPLFQPAANRRVYQGQPPTPISDTQSRSSLSRNGRTISIQPPCKTGTAWSILKDIRGALEKIDRRNINPQDLANIRKWLQNAPEIREVLLDAPLKRTDTPHPLDAFVDECEKLTLWIDAIQYHYDFFESAVRESDQSWLAEGEFSVPDNGDCLFEAFQYHSKMNSSLSIDVHGERLKTVKWIRKHYKADEELQRHLVSSMIEHFFSKSEHLETERQGLLQGLSSGIIKKSEDNPIRLKQIGDEIETIETVYIPAFQKAMGSAHTDDFNFAPASPYVEAYLDDMSQKGEHASQAELYALSHRHKVCFKIHAKRPEKHEVDLEPYITINSQYESLERPAWHFTHSRNHDNPYYPPSSK